jgi:hypothetical protein
VAKNDRAISPLRIMGLKINQEKKQTNKIYDYKSECKAK